MLRRLILLACVLVLAPLAIPAHAAGSPRIYEGTTAQLQKGGEPYTVMFHLVKRDDGTFRLKVMEFGATLTCEDASQLFYYFGFGFGRAYPLEGRTLAYDQVSFDFAVHVHGRFRARQADGTLEITVPALTADEQAQICTSGEVAWTALRTQPPIPDTVLPNGETRSISLNGGTTRVDIVTLRRMA